MLNLASPVEVGVVQQAVNTLFNLNKCTIGSKVFDCSFDNSTWSVVVSNALPRVTLNFAY